MKKSITHEFWVGFFLLIGISAFVFLGLKVANVQGISHEKTYEISAIFDNIGGLKERSPVKIGGVVVGRVEKIYLDKQTYLPVVDIAIDSKYSDIPGNSSLAIRTAGLLGEQYIALNVGFDDGETPVLKNGSKIVATKSAMVLEDLVGQFIYGDKNKK